MFALEELSQGSPGAGDSRVQQQQLGAVPKPGAGAPSVPALQLAQTKTPREARDMAEETKTGPEGVFGSSHTKRQHGGRGHLSSALEIWRMLEFRKCKQDLPE